MDSHSSSLSSISYRRQQSSNLQEGRNVCECGITEVIWTSWTNENPGRRFYGCCNYRSSKGVIPKAGCNHFRWCDVEMSDRVKEVLNTLKMEKPALLKENRNLAKQCESVLVAENAVQKKANSEMLIMKKSLKRVKFALFVTWLLLISIWLGKI
ncbi:hypothetical protein C2S51_031317 [Perilla frutescens var. frutescens]|nr:hypothetical protein C2S51_031317 [Perilla frutescens var. frutescens]